MSDDRLFASNNAIGRKWYFLNIIILAVITVLTKYIFSDYIIPNVRTEVYEIIANGIMYFAYLIYIITFFALIDRRLYDACGVRDNKGYKNTSAILKFAVCFQILILVGKACNVDVPVSYDVLQYVAWFFNVIFLIIAFCLGFVNGKISNLTYEQYKNKIKYQW